MKLRTLSEALQRQWGFLLTFTLSLVGYGGLVRLDWLHDTLRGPYTPETITWYLITFTAFLGAILWSEYRPIPAKWLWGGAILFRLLLLFTSPTLSDDIYRYLWDGHVSVNGVSPYIYPIDAPELDYLEVPVRDLANNTWMASPYLPASQWIFHSLAFLFPLEPIYLQILMVGFDLLSGLLLVGLLRLAALPAHRLLIYLWNPLVIVEVAHGAHIDAWMVLFNPRSGLVYPKYTTSPKRALRSVLFSRIADLISSRHPDQNHSPPAPPDIILSVGLAPANSLRTGRFRCPATLWITGRLGTDWVYGRSGGIRRRCEYTANGGNLTAASFSGWKPG